MTTHRWERPCRFSCVSITYTIVVTTLVVPSAASMTLAQAEPTSNSISSSDPPDIFENPPDEALREEIDSLIRRLDYPGYAERKSVTQKLMEINAPALPQLRTVYLETDDLEVGLRIEQIVHNIYFDYHVFNRKGFLGIRMAVYIPESKPFVSVPEGRSAMRVRDVIDETGAKRAGLRKGDVIIAIDDVPLQGEGRLLTDSFGASISARRPGETMVLTIVRRDKVLNIPAILGRTPEELLRGQRRDRVVGTAEFYHEVRERFPSWWTTHFRARVDPLRPTEGHQE